MGIVDLPKRAVMAPPCLGSNHVIGFLGPEQKPVERVTRDAVETQLVEPTVDPGISISS
jgi:hypothetical protein